MAQNRTLLSSGDVAPSFSLPNQDEQEVRLSDFKGKKLIVFFYPAAMTPGCTTQACDFRDSIGPLQAAGYTVVGISPDEPEKLRRFRERDHLTYDLLSDPDLTVLTAYGAYGEKNLYGRVVEGVIRSTFVIDGDGLVEHALYNVKATGHVGRIRKLVGVAQD